MTTPVHRMAPAARRAHADQFVGLAGVEVTVARLREAGPKEVLRGRVLSVATNLTGAGGDVIVVRHRHDTGELADYAVSLAMVEAITPTAGR